MKYFNNEEAVSPVIGVILMVAITVILAAVIGVFVFGLAGGIQSTKTVAFIANQNTSNGIDLVVHGGPDLSKVNWVNITIDGTRVTSYGGTPEVGEIIGDSSGSITDISGSRVIVTAGYSDGSSAIVVDKSF